MSSNDGDDSKHRVDDLTQRLRDLSASGSPDENSRMQPIQQSRARKSSASSGLQGRITIDDYNKYIESLGDKPLETKRDTKREIRSSGSGESIMVELTDINNRHKIIRVRKKQVENEIIKKEIIKLEQGKGEIEKKYAQDKEEYLEKKKKYDDEWNKYGEEKKKYEEDKVTYEREQANLQQLKDQKEKQEKIIKAAEKEKQKTAASSSQGDKSSTGNKWGVVLRSTGTPLDRAKSALSQLKSSVGGTDFHPSLVGRNTDLGKILDEYIVNERKNTGEQLSFDLVTTYINNEIIKLKEKKPKPEDAKEKQALESQPELEVEIKESSEPPKEPKEPEIEKPIDPEDKFLKEKKKIEDEINKKKGAVNTTTTERSEIATTEYNASNGQMKVTFNDTPPSQSDIQLMVKPLPTTADVIIFGFTNESPRDADPNALAHLILDLVDKGIEPKFTDETKKHYEEKVSSSPDDSLYTPRAFLLGKCDDLFNEKLKSINDENEKSTFVTQYNAAMRSLGLPEALVQQKSTPSGTHRYP